MRERRPLTIRGNVTRMRTYALGLLVLLVAFAGVGIALAEIYGVAADNAGKTVVAAQDLQYAVGEQDAGISGYVAAHQLAFLTLYREGQFRTGRALADLVTDTAGTSEEVRVAQVGSDIRAWQRWAEAVRLQTVVVATETPATALEGDRLFGDRKSVVVGREGRCGVGTVGERRG